MRKIDKSILYEKFYKNETTEAFSEWIIDDQEFWNRLDTWEKRQSNPSLQAIAKFIQHDGVEQLNKLRLKMKGWSGFFYSEMENTFDNVDWLQIAEMAQDELADRRG